MGKIGSRVYEPEKQLDIQPRTPVPQKDYYLKELHEICVHERRLSARKEYLLKELAKCN